MARRKPEPPPPCPTPSPRDELLALAQELGLTTLGLVWDELVQRAQDEALDYTRLVRELLRREQGARCERRLNRLLRRSRLGEGNDLDGFDFSCRPGLDERAVRELLHCDWIRQRRPMIGAGGPGRGKTRVFRALGRAACAAGFSVLYAVTADVLDDLEGSRLDGSYRKTFRRYAQPDLLILDEFGYRRFTQTATDELYRLVDARYERRSTAVIASTGFKRWCEYFPSVPHAVATVDRLIDQATILRFSGKPFRAPKEILGAELED